MSLDFCTATPLLGAAAIGSRQARGIALVLVPV